MIAATPTLLAAAWALVHFLWQGALVGLATALALRLTRAQDPRVRYLIACVGLSLCLLLPLATGFILRPVAYREAGFQPPPSAVPAAAATMPAGPGRQPSPEPVPAPGWPSRLRFALNDHLILLVRAWLLGCAALTLRFLGGWLVLQRLRRSASTASASLQAQVARVAARFGPAQPLRLGLSARIQTPLVVGWLRPMLLLPVGLIAAIDPLGLEALLVHELAHIRRHDYLINVGQCLIEILLFYHPAVWWISARIRTERELCCDDAAVAWCQNPLLYAETLNHLHAFRRETLSPALAAGGGDLMFRIKRLVLPRLQPRRRPLPISLAAVLASLGLALTVTLSLHAMQAPQPNAGSWYLAGANPKDYAMASDPDSRHDGHISQRITSATTQPEGFATIMQERPAAEFTSKRVRLSAWVKTSGVLGWSGLWLRVDGAAHRVLAFDNMANRPLSGSRDWEPVSVVLEVAPEARRLAYGLLLSGPGQAWLADVRLEPVSAEVPVTDTGSGRHLPVATAMQPSTWSLAGSRPQDYTQGLDSTTPRLGQPTQLLAAKPGPSNKGFGTLMQALSSQPFLGKRVRFSAWVKAENVETTAGLWLRVDGPTGISAFDNMGNRPIRGSSDWQRYQVVLDVAANAKGLALGLLLNGGGKLWLSEPSLEVVGDQVASTAIPGTAEALSSENWFYTGGGPDQFTLSQDPATPWEGKPSHLLSGASDQAEAFGTLMQMVKATAYRGHRVRLSLWVKAEQIQGWGGAWLRVDGPDGKSTAFDNMHDRPILGSRAWQRYQVVLDVAEDARSLALGVLISGKGKVWVGEPTLERVDPSVPVTGGPVRAS